MDHCYCGDRDAVLFLRRRNWIAVRLWRADPERVGSAPLSCARPDNIILNKTEPGCSKRDRVPCYSKNGSAVLLTRPAPGTLCFHPGRGR
jgi:hypothetical protein